MSHVPIGVIELTIHYIIPHRSKGKRWIGKLTKQMASWQG
jgi:hypothetical protein